MVTQARTLLFCLAILLVSGATFAATPLPHNPTWHLQLDGRVALIDRQVIDIDLFDTTSQTISDLKNQGKYVICYFSAGTFENWRSDVSNFPSTVIGKNVKGWKGESWLDIRQPSVMAAMQGRLDLAVTKSCMGVDADNMDGYTQNSGFTMSQNDQIGFANALASAAHARGLSIGLKNAIEIIPSVEGNFDFAVNESCLKYKECAGYAPFVQAGKNVFAVEYTGYSKKKCAAAQALGLNIQFYKKSLKAPGRPCN